MAKYITLDGLGTFLSKLKDGGYKASTSEFGAFKAAGVRSSAISSTTGTTSGRYYGVEIDSNGKAFVNVPWTDTNTDTSTTLTGHYTPSANTGSTLSAAGGTLTDIANSSSGVQVVTGLKRDAKGHVVGVNSVALKSTNTTYSAATTGAAGLMSAADKTKLDGIATGANKYTLPNAGTASKPIYITGNTPTQCTSIDNTLISKSAGTSTLAWNTEVTLATIAGQAIKAKLPANPDTNSDTKVTQTTTTSNANYPLLLAPSGQTATTTTTSYFKTNVTLNPFTNILSGAKVYESLLQWGNTNISGGLSPMDTAMDGQWSANRLSFQPVTNKTTPSKSGVIVEYSTNGGTTWTDYGLTDAEKTSLITTGLSADIRPGKLTTGQVITSGSKGSQVRVTISAFDFYFSLKKIYIYLSVNGASNMQVKIEESKCGSDTTYTTVGTYKVDGWSGWNSIPCARSFGGGETQTSNTRRIRMTFFISAISSGYESKTGASIYKIAMVGETMWGNSGGNLPLTGHLYNWDASKNAIFPTNVYANTFVGSLSGNATSATKATQDGSGRTITTTYSTTGHTHSTITTSGRLSGETTTNRASGLRLYEIYSNGYPCTYGNVLQLNGANGVGQIACQWHGTGLWYRSAPDTSTTFSDWVNILTNENSSVTGGGSTWGSSITVNIGGTSKTLTIPANPNTDTKVTSVDNHYKGSLGAKSSGLYKVAFDAAGHITGATAVTKADITALGIPGSDTNTAHKHAAGVGLICDNTTGTTSGTVTYKAKLKSETASTLDSAAMGSHANRQYAVGVDKSGYLSVNVPWTTTPTGSTTTYGVLKVKTGDLSDITSNADSIAASYYHNHDKKYAASGHTHSDASGTSKGFVKLVTGDLGGETYANGEAAAAAHTHGQYALQSDMQSNEKVIASALTDLDYRIRNVNANAISTSSGITSNATDLVQGKAVRAYAAPKVHTSSTSGTYGAATTSLYGHVKLSNSDVSTVATANGLAAGMDHYHSKTRISTSSANGYYPMLFVNATTSGDTAILIDSSTGTGSTSNGIRYNPSGNTCYCSGGFFEASDERLKNFGDDIDVDLDKLAQLPKKYFTWKHDKDGKVHIGTSAQELQKIYPELVDTLEDGTLIVSYDTLSVIALKGVDVLYEKYKTLEERLNKIEKMLG